MFLNETISNWNNATKSTAYKRQALPTTSSSSLSSPSHITSQVPLLLDSKNQRKKSKHPIKLLHSITLQTIKKIILQNQIQQITQQIAPDQTRTNVFQIIWTLTLILSNTIFIMLIKLV